MHRLIKNATKKLRESTFDLNSKDLKVYLKESNSKGSNFNPLRNTGYVETYQSYTVIKAIIKQVSGSSLVAREIGLDASGSIYAYVKDSDVTFLTAASKIEYENEFYSTYHKALGNKFLVTKLDLGLSKIMLFKIGNKNG